MFYFDILWKKKGKVFSKIENLARHMKEKKTVCIMWCFKSFPVSCAKNQPRKEQKKRDTKVDLRGSSCLF